MSAPFYVAPEQMMKDRADFARKGIARGRSLAAMCCADGVAICAENTSRTLRKVSEIYDRIAFGGVGKYNEFDQLRIAGVRHADLKGWSYSRADVDARSLANQYAQLLGQTFTHEMKPMEVEILVAECGDTEFEDQLFHILYDGTVHDKTGFALIGGDAETAGERLEALYEPGLPVQEGLARMAESLSGPDRQLSGADLEAAVIERGVSGRAVRRLSVEELLDAVPDPAGGELADQETETPDDDAVVDSANPAGSDTKGSGAKAPGSAAKRSGAKGSGSKGSGSKGSATKNPKAKRGDAAKSGDEESASTESAETTTSDDQD